MQHLKELVTARVNKRASPWLHPDTAARALDEELSRAYAVQGGIPVVTGALQEALTTPGHPNKRVSWEGGLSGRLRFTVRVWHPLPVFRPGRMPPVPLGAVTRALERVREEAGWEA